MCPSLQLLLVLCLMPSLLQLSNANKKRLPTQLFDLTKPGLRLWSCSAATQGRGCHLLLQSSEWWAVGVCTPLHPGSWIRISVPSLVSCATWVSHRVPGSVSSSTRWGLEKADDTPPPVQGICGPESSKQMQEIIRNSAGEEAVEGRDLSTFCGSKPSWHFNCPADGPSSRGGLTSSAHVFF